MAWPWSKVGRGSKSSVSRDSFRTECSLARWKRGPIQRNKRRLNIDAPCSPSRRRPDEVVVLGDDDDVSPSAASLVVVPIPFLLLSTGIDLWLLSFKRRCCRFSGCDWFDNNNDCVRTRKHTNQKEWAEHPRTTKKLWSQVTKALDLES